MSVVSVAGLSKRFRALAAVDDVSFTIEQNRIYGLLGRNGAGKTTLMQLLTGQEFASAGDIRVFGENPLENPRVLTELCFIKESQRYPDEYRVRHVFQIAPRFFRRWDAAFAERLIDDFQLPLSRPMKKLSRGQLSAVGVIVGLASRAPLSFFDEPYLGLDAVARQVFYDRLLADHADHPRTIVLSTHLIDEVGGLLQHVFVIDHGRLIIDSDTEDLRGTATTIAGTGRAVEAFLGARPVLHRDAIGALASVTVEGRFDARERLAAEAAGLELLPVSLQQLIVRRTGASVTDYQPTV